jgi:hypothetical protein
MQQPTVLTPSASDRGAVGWAPVASDRHARQHCRCADDQPLLRGRDRDVFDDHGFPHFHARHAGASAKVRFDQIDVIESNLEVRQLRLVLAWAELHRDELLENWRRARAGETLLEIEPLR